MIINSSGDNVDSNVVELVWENSAPTSEFASQTVTLDLSKYRVLFIAIFNGASKSSLSTSPVINDSTITQLLDVCYNKYFYSRTATVVATGIQFGGGVRTSMSDGTNISGNGYAIPYRIYGLI